MKTNREWLNELAANDVDALQAWFDAPHGGLDAPCAHYEQVDGNDVDSGADSREQLERDIDVWLDSMTGWSIPARTIKQDIIAWLDRQAAITRAECETCDYKQANKRQARKIKNVCTLNDELTRKLDNLAAERDEKAGLLETAFRRCKELEAENNALMAAHADDVERLDSMGEGELTRKLDELQEEVEEMQDELKRVWKESEKWKARCAELQAERDSFEHDLSETEAKFAKEMAETLSLHSKQQAASHQAWVDAVDERDYWKQEVQYCMNAAYPPSHAPERPYNPHVMDYPPSGAYTTPSTMVSAVIDGLRDEKMAEWKGVFEQLSKAEAERDRYRELASELLDAAHNMQLIADRGLA